MSLPKILFIDDDDGVVRMVQRTTEGRVEAVIAQTLDDAQAKFQSDGPFMVVFVDGCVPGRTLNTIPFIQWLRTRFDGPILAMASDPSHRDEQVRSGCDYGFEKPHFVQLLSVLLKIRSAQ